MESKLLIQKPQPSFEAAVFFGHVPADAQLMTSSNPDPRLGPRTKVDRAKEHLENLDNEINAFTESNPYTFRVHIDSDGVHHLILDSHKLIPLRWAAIIGDILSNARSALDHIASCAATIEAKTPQKFDFPIFTHRTDFEAKGLKRFGEGCPRTVRFIKLLKPYERGDDLGLHSNTLVLLNRLRTRDMHNLLIPVGTAAAKAIVTPQPGFGDPFVLHPPDALLLNDGDIVMSISPRDPLFAGKKFNTQVTTQIRLTGVEKAIPIGASAVLHHIVKIVDRIVGIAERQLFN